MSAATSGFELPLKIRNPTEADLVGFQVGRRLIYKEKFFSAQKIYSEWFIAKVDGDFVHIQPLRGLHPFDNRKIRRDEVLKHFIIRNHI